MRERLPVNALDIALYRRSDAAGCILHSDRGCQFAKHFFAQHLETIMEGALK